MIGALIGGAISAVVGIACGIVIERERQWRASFILTIQQLANIRRDQAALAYEFYCFLQKFTGHVSAAEIHKEALRYANSLTFPQAPDDVPRPVKTGAEA